MKTITQYKEDLKALMKKVADIDAKCVSENRDPVESELTLKNEILDTVKEFQEIVKTQERQERITSELETPQAAVTDPKPTVKVVGTGIEVRDKDKFRSLGEQMAAVINAGTPNRTIDPRLYNAATGLGETVPSEGGFLIQQDFAPGLLQEVFETGLLSQKCRTIEISSESNSIKLNGVDETSRASSLWGGIQVYMADEAATVTATKPKFRKIELNLHKMMGICYLTEELMRDVSALEGWVKQGFTSAFGFKIDDQIFQGTGAGQALGFMNGGSIVSIAKESGQAKETVVFENVVNMYSRLFASSRKNATWYINQNVEPQLFRMSLSVGTGGVPVYMPAGGISGQPYGTLFGRPVMPIEHCATLGTVGDIVLADLTDGYIMARKGGFQQDASIHVQFLYDEQVLRFITRFDGQPVRASPLTPYKGGSDYTQAHFVSLATRA